MIMVQNILRKHEYKIQFWNGLPAGNPFPHGEDEYKLKLIWMNFQKVEVQKFKIYFSQSQIQTYQSKYWRVHNYYKCKWWSVTQKT